MKIDTEAIQTWLDEMRLKTVPKYPPWNEIKIIYHTQDKLEAMVEIESDEYGILYYSPWESHHGMQCNFEADSPEYQKLFELCTTIEKAAREINKLYNGTKKEA